MVELLRRLDHEVPNEHSWQTARDALSVSSVRRNGEEKRVPTRIARMLASLRRVGPQTKHGNVDALIAEFGFTGVELGKWIRNSETALLLQSVSNSCFDLRRLLGNWVSPMTRKGNLALALGARGKGRGCAHYEPSLRVINLTKTRGDGSFAHEFSHFLDHMLASHSSQGDSRFLSDRVSAEKTDTNPIANAMRALMGAIGTAPTMNVIQGIADPDRWFGEAWVLKAWKTEKHNAQPTFDRLAGQYPNKFQTDRSSATSCQTLANSLVKWTGEPIVVNAFHKKESAFLKEARRLGAYWSRPHELFARAFEFWCEDELTGRSELNEYLVDGTRNDYSKCRGLPYATGEPRLEINQRMKQLLAACSELADA